MKLTLTDTVQFKESVNIISNLVSEATFNISKDGIELIAMDAANVAMVIFKMFSSCFSEYDANDIKITMDLNSLKQIWRRVSQNDIVTLGLEENQLIIKITGDTIRTFNLPLIKPEDKEQKIPELKLSASIKMPSETLVNSIDDADIVAESLSFEAEKRKFRIFAEGDSSQVYIEINESDTTKIEAGNKTKSKYSIEYLKKMIGGSKLSDKVEIGFSKDYPLKIDFNVIDKLSLSFILAPRVENE